MQQVNPVGLRVGAVQNWTSDKLVRSRITFDISWRSSLPIRYTFARYGCYLLNFYTYRLSTSNSLTAVFVHYRYIQRGRLIRHLSAILRRGDAVLAPLAIRVYFNRRLVNLRPRSHFLDLLFNKKYFSEVYLRGWGDLELLYLLPTEYLYRRSIHYKIQRELVAVFRERCFVSVYSINQFFALINPLVFSSYYVFKRFSALRYLHDLIQITIIATRLGTSKLLGHALAIGIEKHETKRKQRYFLKIFEKVLDRVLSWELVYRKPLDWRVSIYGRLDGRIRRMHILIKVGCTRYQHLDNLINYSYTISKTKFSTSSVRVWIRNLSHWR
jgi:Ribosomal protein S3, C-terminal domain.